MLEMKIQPHGLDPALYSLCLLWLVINHLNHMGGRCMVKSVALGATVPGSESHLSCFDLGQVTNGLLPWNLVCKMGIGRISPAKPWWED